MIEELETFTLDEDIPAFGLRRGDLGTAVLVHPDGSCEAEFVSPAGDTLALITLSPHQFRVSGRPMLDSGKPSERPVRTS